MDPSTSLAVSGPLLAAVAVAVLAGAVSFASPCVVPLVPGYLAYLAGLVGADAPPATADEARRPRSGRWRVAGAAALFVAGFTAVFGAILVGVVWLADALVRNEQVLQRVGGVVMIGMGLVISPFLFLVIPASILIGAAFSAACLATTAYLRTVQDFDLPMGLVVMPMFLFSGTFFPISLYPQPIQLAMELTPLFHAVGLLRGLATGLMGWHELWDLAYIVAFGAIAMWIALNRLEQRLIK